MSDKSIQDHYSEPTAHCYGCGRLNIDGLQIKSYLKGEETICRFKPRAYHTAFEGYVYGGLLASLIDCHGTGTAAAFAYKEAHQEFGSLPEHRYVTASLHVDYLKPTPMVELELKGRITETKGRKTVVEVDLFAQGELCVRGRVVAVKAPETFFAALKSE